MQAQFIAAALLAASTAAAYADDWRFSYTGFTWADSNVFDPNVTVSGTFSGFDLDNNGIIARDELTALTILDRTYLQGCLSLTDFYHRCTLDRFSYKLTGELDIKARFWGSDGIAASWGSGLTTGEQANSYWDSPWGSDMRSWLWSEQTALSLTPSPVPEPAMATLLAAGLLALAGCRRPHKKEAERSARRQ